MSRRKHTKWHFWDWNLLLFWGSIPIYPGYLEHLWGLFFHCVHLQNLTLHTWQWNKGHLQVMGSIPQRSKEFVSSCSPYNFPSVGWILILVHGQFVALEFHARVLKFSVLRNVKAHFNFDLSSVMKSSHRRRRPPLWYTNRSFLCF